MLVDHILAVTFAIGFPAVSIPIYFRRQPLLRAGDAATRLREYRETVAWLSSMGIATLLVWTMRGRSFTELGLTFVATWQSSLALGIAAGGATLLFLQVRRVRTDARTRAAARKASEPVREFLPEGPQQARWFAAVSVSAGIGEELFYRGFLIWYLTQFLPLGWAVAVSSLVFGFAHIMHGTQAAIRVTFTGAVLAGLYLLGGHLWAPMVLHAAIDLASGETWRAAQEQ